MTIEEFCHSLQEPQPPAYLSPYLRALWYDQKGEWGKSHDIAQEINTRDGARIHAYLHRKEGDIWNADYWYGIAGENRPDISLEEEWNQLLRKFLS